MSGNEKMILIMDSKALPQIKLTPEIRESVLSLPNIPGFRYLLQKLKLQREFLREELASTKGLSEREVDRLQEGIKWTGWLEDQTFAIANVPKPAPPARQLRKSEADMLAEIRRNIIVGEGTDSATSRT